MAIAMSIRAHTHGEETVSGKSGFLSQTTATVTLHQFVAVCPYFFEGLNVLVGNLRQVLVKNGKIDA